MATSSNPDVLSPGARRPHRVVVLCADGVMHSHTCATLIRAGVNVVGVVVCDRTGLRDRGSFVRRWARRHGYVKTLGQVLGKVFDRARNGSRDRALLETLVQEEDDRRVIRESGVFTLATNSYSHAATRRTIAELDPDIFVVHTKYIVGKSVRDLARVATIGGHPGVTPHYRGAYSPFWAILRGDPDMVGWTVFLLDDGLDTGPILAQGRVPVAREGESHLTLAWRGMIEEVRAQAALVKALDAGETLPIRKIRRVPEDSYFGPPTLVDYLRYARAQSAVR